MATQNPVEIMVERLMQRSPPMLQSHGPRVSTRGHHDRIGCLNDVPIYETGPVSVHLAFGGASTVSLEHHPHYIYSHNMPFSKSTLFVKVNVTLLSLNRNDLTDDIFRIKRTSPSCEVAEQSAV
jgi:hypothetical protein